jgi:dephospho-CoA kinase
MQATFVKNDKVPGRNIHERDFSWSERRFATAVPFSYNWQLPEGIFFKLDLAMKLVALVGMPGSGKSEVARVFESSGYKRIRFGDITDEEVGKRGLELNERNERSVREDLRKKYGMPAYAVLSLPKIEAALKTSDVVVDGLYSWEECKYLKDKIRGNLNLVAVWSPPALRYRRLQDRKVRPLTEKQAKARDFAEIENVNKGGPIAMADYTLRNDSTLQELIDQANKILKAIE